VIRIDDEPTEVITLLNAVNKIRGKKGTAVNFTILRGGEEVKDISVIRDKIIIPVLSWQMKEDNIVHLELFSFSQQATTKFREALLEILRNPTEKMILDLRNNPGGFLEVAQELLGWFVEPGEVIAKEDFGEGKRINEYRAIGNGALRNFDIIVLINKGSASASEIMAGALRDIRGIKLVGEKSFGKGSIQQVENLSSGSSIKVTIAKWLTPSGISISEEGLEPDIEVEMTSEDIDEERDPQLDRALEIIKRL
jgi:carboxyl-terminal processing protease